MPWRRRGRGKGVIPTLRAREFFFGELLLDHGQGRDRGGRRGKGFGPGGFARARPLWMVDVPRTFPAVSALFPFSGTGALGAGEGGREKKGQASPSVRRHQLALHSAAAILSVCRSLAFFLAADIQDTKCLQPATDASSPR